MNILSLMVIRGNQIVYFLLDKLWWFYLFWEIHPFHQHSQSYVYRVFFVVVPFYWWDVLRVCSGIFGFTPNSGSLWLLSFSVSIARILSMLLIFFKESVPCFIHFLYCFLFSIPLISILSLLFLSLGLFCSSFSTFFG